MGIESRLNTLLAQAVRIVGSQSAFGRLIGRDQSTVHDWLKGNVPLPGEYVLLVERETGVPRWQLRPDLYPPEEYADRGEQTPAAAPLDRRPPTDRAA